MIFLFTVCRTKLNYNDIKRSIMFCDIASGVNIRDLQIGNGARSRDVVTLDSPPTHALDDFSCPTKAFTSLDALFDFLNACYRQPSITLIN